jgi:hypothetical protein
VLESKKKRKLVIQMVKSSNRARAVVLAASFGLFLATTSFATTANAATSNGVSCKKAGLKTKVGGKSYVCDKNPYVTPTKLTWTLTSCPEAYALFVDAKDQKEIFKDILSSSPDGLAELANLQKSIDSLDALMKTKVCKKGA